MKKFSELFENKYAESPADKEFANLHITDKEDHPIEDDTEKDMFKGSARDRARRLADNDQVSDRDLEDIQYTDDEDEYDDGEEDIYDEDDDEELDFEESMNRYGSKWLAVEMARQSSLREFFSFGKKTKERPGVYNVRIKNYGVANVKAKDKADALLKAGKALQIPTGRVRAALLRKATEVHFLKDQEGAKVWASKDKMHEETLAEADGWIAIYNGKKFEITKAEASSLYDAKKKAIVALKVPKSKQNLVAIRPAYNESVNLDEVYREGTLTLRDGSEVNIDSVTAEALNSLYTTLNLSNRKKMDEAIVSDSETFQRITAFAKGEEVEE